MIVVMLESSHLISGGFELTADILNSSEMILSISPPPIPPPLPIVCSADIFHHHSSTSPPPLPPTPTTTNTTCDPFLIMYLYVL
jgi:hypothetical protein